MKNLCEEGFTEAVYFYDTRYATAASKVSCRTYAGKENTLLYKQVSPLRGHKQDLVILLGLIYRHVRDPALGPIYGHCWNGWHASGFVAAAALRQFCGFTAEEAMRYWILNTDGNSDYPRVKRLVASFQPVPGLALSAEERTDLCPNPTTLNFSK
ncbi:MAG: hypothetical protein AB7K68_12435 [Bacteriovoracia bacterium]